MVGYPALVDQGDHVAIRVLDDPLAQHRAMRRGTRRLLLLDVPSPAAAVGRRLDNRTKLLLARSPHADVGALLTDCLQCAVDALVARHGGPVWDAEGFAALRDAVAGDLTGELETVIGHVRGALAAEQQVTAKLGELEGRAGAASAYGASLSDAKGQLAALIRPGFVTATGKSALAHLPRYLEALQRRLDKLPADPARDQANVVTLEEVRREFMRVANHAAKTPETDEQLREARWMIEELRVSLFAQELGTPYRVSPKRVFSALAQIGTQ